MQVATWLAYVQAHAYTYTLVQPNAGAPVATMGLYGGPFTTQYQASLFPGVPQESNNGLSNTFGSLAALYNNSSTTKTTTNGFFVNLANNTSLDYSSASSNGSNGLFCNRCNNSPGLSVNKVSSSFCPTRLQQLRILLLWMALIRCYTSLQNWCKAGVHWIICY